jgi:hypothetical protein
MNQTYIVLILLYSNTGEAYKKHNEISGSGKTEVTALHLAC